MTSAPSSLAKAMAALEQPCSNAPLPVTRPYDEAIDRPGLHIVDPLEQPGSVESRELVTRADLDPPDRVIPDIANQAGRASFGRHFGETITVVPLVSETVVGSAPVHAKAASGNATLAEDHLHVGKSLWGEGPAGHRAEIGLARV